MRTITLFAFLVLVSPALGACEFSLLSSCNSYTGDIHAKRFSLNPRSPFSNNGFHAKGVKILKPGIPLSFNSCSAIYSDFHLYNTTFDRSAVFCRMENYTLKRYSVKFSIHAGGYRERG